MYEWFLVICIWMQPLGVDSGEQPTEIHMVERTTTQSSCEGKRDDLKTEFPLLHSNVTRFACIGIPNDKVKI